MFKLVSAAAVVVGIAILPSFMAGPGGTAEASSDPYPGQLTIIGKDRVAGALCPLERTSVTADIAGFGARVVVKQAFVNPTSAAIEAVYTFPLPHDAAVDRMRMRIGDRVIEGTIKRREEARQIYDQARANGQVASLLDQERPNIFTQSVANIMPKARVEVEISYVQVLKYEAGQFEFNFPMVVGPRYTANAPDPGKISPPIVHKDQRAGNNIDLTVNIAAGTGIRELKSALHQVVSNLNGERAQVKLKKQNEIPNRDFVLRYRTATDTVQSAFITHMDPAKGGFFTLLLMPPKRPVASQIAPREMIFVVDQSGSQTGFPIEKSKELTLQMIKAMRPGDTFNVLGFNNVVVPLWPGPRSNSPENLAEATQFVSSLQANGGTELRAGVEAALSAPADPTRLRLVVFNTDGYVGDELQVLKSIAQFRSTARMFTFGIGNSVNRYLIDAMSVAGRGDSETVFLSDNAQSAVAKFVKRTQSPILTNIQVEFEGVPVEQVMPTQIPDVFDDRPIVIYGRYTQAGGGRVTVSGNIGSEPWSQTLEVQFGASEAAPSLMSLWARRRVDDLQRATIYPADGEGAPATQESVIQTALEFSIMTEGTSFVAVEPKVVNVGGKQRTVRVPVEMADGVNLNSGLKEESAKRYSFGGGGSTGGTGGSTGSTTGATTGATTGGGKLYYPATAAPANRGTVIAGAKVKSFDKSKESFADSTLSIPNKIDKSLANAKGKVDVQVWVTSVDDKTLKALKRAGLKVEASDKGLKIVFGTCDASKLKDLAKLISVRKISLLK